MQRLIDGIRQFQVSVFQPQKELFKRLAHGQKPETLFITCSDSRINPNLITMTDPGELFILRNAGNIIPPYGAANGGEGATIEFAVAALGVREIILCGHSHCGAMKGLLNPDQLQNLPATQAWLRHAEATRRIVQENYSHLQGEDILNLTILENILVQLENLRTHPVVAAGLCKGTLTLHGWVYKLETGEVLAYDPARSEFVPVDRAGSMPILPVPALRLGAAKTT